MTDHEKEERNLSELKEGENEVVEEENLEVKEEDLGKETQKRNLQKRQEKVWKYNEINRNLKFYWKMFLA